MALNEPRTWLIAYDITSPKRLGRVHRHLRKRAVPVQYSVFVVHDTPAYVGRLRNELMALIDARSDDVRIYPVPENPQLSLLGRRAMPEGVMLIRSGAEIPFADTHQNGYSHHCGSRCQAARSWVGG